MDNLYLGEKCKKLDPRAVFIIQASHNGDGSKPMYIWQGGNVPDGNLTPYMNEARRYIKVLQKNERAPEQVVTIEQGSEDAQFWSLFFPDKPVPQPNELYGNVAEWNNILIDVSTFFCN